MMFERVFTSQQSLYKHILKEQLCEVALWDSFQLECFKRSPGANELSNRVGVSLARDEAHERVISLGLAFHHPLHPTPQNVQIMCNSAPILSQNHDNLIRQFFPSTKTSERSESVGKKKEEEKILQSFVNVLNKNQSFHIVKERQLIQPGSTEITPREKVESFLNKNKISKEIATAVVDQQILKRTNFDRERLKKRVILPLPPTDVKPKKRKPKENLEKKLISNLLMSNLKQQLGLQVDSLPGVGVSKYPVLLFNQDGSPLVNKGKSSLKVTILKRYGENAFFFYGNTSCQEKAVFIDGMPPLHLVPLTGMKTFKDWVNFMLKRKVLKFLKEADEIHVVYDCPEIWGFNLKKKLQDERDSKSMEFPTLVGDITDSTPIPSTAKEWPNLLANRENKKKIIKYIGETLIGLKDTLEARKGIVIGGCTEDGKTYLVKGGSIEPLQELQCNHEEADTRIFAHAKLTEKNICHIVAADTDILSILLLNFDHFTAKTMLLDQSDHGRVLHMNALVNAMNEDQDTDLIALKQRNDISIPMFFALVHLLIGSDILCSPRGFGPAMVLKACIDFSPFLFSKEKGIQNLRFDDHNCEDAYCRFILALYKKRYANKIKMSADEMFGTTNIGDTLQTVRENVFLQTLENNSVIPSKECMELRALNLSFQLKV